MAERLVSRSVAAEPASVLVKPDAVRRALTGEIVARFERRSLAIKAARLLTVDRSLAEEHYAEHTEKPFFGELVDFITSGPTTASSRKGAIKTVRTTIGRPTRRRGAGNDPRRPLALDAGQPRPRFRLARVVDADRPVVPR